MPRSSSASRPSSVSIRLPGCGSACRTPWSSISVEVAAEELLDHRPRVDVEQAQRADVGDLAALDALHGEHPRGGVVEDRRGHHQQVVVLGQVPRTAAGCGPRGGSPARRRATAGTARAAARTRTAGRPRCACRRARPAGRASPCPRGRPPGRSGRWTFTTTSRPLGSVARCTCPSEAAASGSALELREQVPDLPAELGLDDLLDLLEGERLGVVLEPRQRGGVRRGQQVEAGREQLAELDVRRAELLEVPRRTPPPSPRRPSEGPRRRRTRPARPRRPGRIGRDGPAAARARRTVRRCWGSGQTWGTACPFGSRES